MSIKYAYAVWWYIETKPDQWGLRKCVAWKDMRMIQLLCNASFKNGLRSGDFRGRLHLGNIGRCMQNKRLWWYGHSKEWMRTLSQTDVEVAGSVPRGSLKKKKHETKC